MTPLQRLGIIAALLVAATGTGWLLGNAHGVARASAKAQAAQTQSDQHEGAAQTHAAQAAEQDRQAREQASAVQAAESQVEAAKRGLDTALKVLPNKPPASFSPASLRADGAGSANSSEIPKGSALPSYPVIPDSSGVTDSLTLTTAALTQAKTVIADQGQEIAALKLQVSIEHASAVQWKAAYEESQKTLALEHIAKDAAVHQAESSGVRAQLIRGLEGLALGYAAGRFQH